MSMNLTESFSLVDFVEPLPAELIRMMLPEVKVIYSDVDGSLLGPGGCLFKDAKHALTGRPANAVLECHQHNIDVVLVSGRNRHQLFADARLLGFKNWIAELGCQIIYNMGEVLLNNIGDFPIGEETVWDAINSVGAPKVLLDEYKGFLEYHLPWSDNRECTHLLRGSINTDAANGLLKDNGFEQLKIIDNGKVRRRSDALDPSIEEVHAYHLLPKSSSKATAVLKDRETRGIPKNACAAIGDSIADLELAPEVGVLFLVRNAIKENPQILERIKDYPNVFITHEEMGLGWAEAVGYLLGKSYL